MNESITLARRADLGATASEPRHDPTQKEREDEPLRGNGKWGSGDLDLVGSA
jgi:hypothetical protein